MATTITSGGGFSFSVDSVGGKWSWTVSIVNVTGLNQIANIIDIRSPWGFLTDVAQPLPGDVILAMADSLNQFQQQLAPLLFVTSPLNFTSTITEGDPSSVLAVMSGVNAGAFGSFMTVTATPGVSWLTTDPVVNPGIGKNLPFQFNAKVLPGSLLATNSPYNGIINLQDNRNPATIVPINFNIIVLPRPVIGTNINSIGLIYYQSTSVTGGAVQLTVTNSGAAGSVLNFTVSKLLNVSPWLTFDPTSGGPLASGGTSAITFAVNQAGLPALPGTYSETIRISSSNASNSPIDIPVSLSVI